MSVCGHKWNSDLDISQDVEHTEVLLPFDFQGQSWKYRGTQNPGRDDTFKTLFSCLNRQYK